MVSVKGSFVTSKTVPSAIMYRKIVSKYLQKQFVHSCALILILCWACAYVIGDKHSIRNLFPWTMTGARTIGLFLAIFPLALIRKVNMQVVSVWNGVPSKTGFQRVFGASTGRTIGVYTFAVLVVSHLYLKNCRNQNSFSFLVTHNSYELPRLNERWIYLQFFRIWSGLLAGLYHILHNMDQLDIPATRTMPVLFHQVQNLPSGVLLRAASASLVVSISGPVVYLIFRQSLFALVMRCITLIRALPRTHYPRNWPVDFDMFLKTISLSFVLSLLCFWLNGCFTIYLSQNPASKGRTLSASSRHPNETLLNGLQEHNSGITQRLALLELRYLSEEARFRNRRSAIFEAGALDAVQWQCILEVCMEAIERGAQTLRRALNLQGTVQHSSANGSHQPPLPGSSQAHSPHAVKVVQANIYLGVVQKHNTFDKFKSDSTSTEANQKQAAEVYRYSREINQAIATRLQNAATIARPYLSALGIVEEGYDASRIFHSVEVQILAVLSLQDMLAKSIEEDVLGRVYKDVPRVLSAFLSLHSLLSACLQQQQPTAREPSGSTEKIIKARELERILVSALELLTGLFSDYVDLSPDLKKFKKT